MNILYVLGASWRRLLPVHGVQWWKRLWWIDWVNGPFAHYSVLCKRHSCTFSDVVCIVVRSVSYSYRLLWSFLSVLHCLCCYNFKLINSQLLLLIDCCENNDQLSSRPAVVNLLHLPRVVLAVLTFYCSLKKILTNYLHFRILWKLSECYIADFVGIM